jgi:hypothetical protein
MALVIVLFAALFYETDMHQTETKNKACSNKIYDILHRALNTLVPQSKVVLGWRSKREDSAELYEQ